MQIQQASKKNRIFSGQPDGYAGNGHFSYGLTAHQRDEIIKSLLKSTKETPEIIKKTVLSLYKGKSSDEKYAASRILQFRKDVRKLVTPDDVDNYLNYLKGWAEVDSLCQQVFDDKDFNNSWFGWKNLLIKLSKDRNINKRRASVVLLVKPVRDSTGEKFSKIAFENIERLKCDRDKLVTKAVSWILRSMIKNHRDKVESYLVRNLKVLPSVTVREVREKLLTGRK